MVNTKRLNELFTQFGTTRQQQNSISEIFSTCFKELKTRAFLDCFSWVYIPIGSSYGRYNDPNTFNLYCVFEVFELKAVFSETKNLIFKKDKYFFSNVLDCQICNYHSVMGT